jgi:hypothetical protein
MHSTDIKTTAVLHFDYLIQSIYINGPYCPSPLAFVHIYSFHSSTMYSHSKNVEFQWHITVMRFNIESIFYKNISICLSKYKMLKLRYVCVQYMQQLKVWRIVSCFCHGGIIFVQEFFKGYV